ncbi:DUF2474 family protein [Alteraurantiacibacter palmitatis]|uniref:DUF2474 family protein n=1 Tax=Alteraurantiacibacter palmitatis TaxID=2054628 RepID=A0ABV7E8K7_9SPHN
MRDGLKRLGWFVAIWALSVLAITAVGYLIRAVIAP